MRWNNENQLIQATRPQGGFGPNQQTGVDARYRYDGLGRRIAKNVNGEITRFIYDDIHLIEERDESGTVLAKYIYEPGIDRPVKMIVCHPRRGNLACDDEEDEEGGDPSRQRVYYFLRDALGNVTALMDKNGKIKQQYEYDIYGAPTVKNRKGKVIKKDPISPFLFTGREWDPETGLLYHFRTRAYSTTLGRFLQPDPIGFEARDVNLYRYVGNAPMNWIDDVGLEKKKPDNNPPSKRAHGGDKNRPKKKPTPPKPTLPPSPSKEIDPKGNKPGEITPPKDLCPPPIIKPKHTVVLLLLVGGVIIAVAVLAPPVVISSAAVVVVGVIVATPSSPPPP